MSFGLQYLDADTGSKFGSRLTPHNAPLDPTVTVRAGLAQVAQCASVGPYRPEALRDHDEFKQYHQDTDAASIEPTKPEDHSDSFRTAP